MVRPCVHCQNPLPPGEDRFCCNGCKAAHELIEEAGLGKYYDLRGGPGVVVPEAPKRSEVWLEACEARLKGSTDEVTRLELDVQGLHCAACVWAVEQLFERQEGSCGLVVNPGVGKLTMTIRPGRFDLGKFAGVLGRLGYRLGPSTKEAEGEASRRLLLRIGICAALTMNVMIFTFAVYSGLVEGPLHDLMTNASWVLTTLSVLVGGGPFVRSAVASLQQRALHLDVPVALGIGLAYAGSTYAHFARLGASYLDTVTTFTTLMLVGRLLQERVLERNRRQMLADDGVENLYTHRIEDGQVRVVRVGEVKEGDQLLLRPGDLVPVDARAPMQARVSREWITGESSPVEVGEGGLLEAGSFVVGEQAVEAVAQGGYGASRLAGLLRTPGEAKEQQARRTGFWSVLTRWYVALTLLAAAGAGVGWGLVTGDAGRTVEVVVSVLVVSCPCAFGIAVPVAYELAQGALRRVGVFVRSASLLDRVEGVRRVVFDKTGTLTLGELEVENTEALAGLSEREAGLLWNMALRSRHPKSQAVVKGLELRGLRLVGMQIREVTGKGMEAELEGERGRLGAPGWAGEAAGADLVFSLGARVVGLRLREKLRHDALGRVGELERAGYEVHLLSGDSMGRVEALAQRLRLPLERVRGEASPEDKRAYVATGDALMVGDGVNDAAAMGAALCSATPAGDLPFLPSRTDAYVQGELVTGVRRLLIVGDRLQRVVRWAVGFGLAYNVLAVGAACLGWMSPLVAAVIMPLSSVAVVGYVVGRLRKVEHLAEEAPDAAVALAPSPGAA
ncbi:MAG: heavy metal translocating P-type ATPase metal-binding domain-containing protein [Polyangiaceae bacterium]|jgi:Cu2+-exporting ATPase|nr:heavy metal translocating P-type ATPase metal-binding domain-containing protein [Polyangiaceae bacterium]